MPLIFAFLAALLSIACMVVSLWYGVLWLAGSVATAQGAGIFMLGQIQDRMKEIKVQKEQD